MSEHRHPNHQSALRCARLAVVEAAVEQRLLIERMPYDVAQALHGYAELHGIRRETAAMELLRGALIET